jgi:hypothetical protein
MLAFCWPKTLESGGRVGADGETLNRFQTRRPRKLFPPSHNRIIIHHPPLSHVFQDAFTLSCIISVINVFVFALHTMETSQAEQIPQVRHKFACSLCARRKVKCDKLDPCSNCIKVEAQCLYEVHPPPRPRKRAADDELVARLAAYETLMRKHDIDFSHCATTWVPSGQEVELGETEPLPDTNLSLPSNSVHDALRSTDGASSMVLEK